MNLYKKMYVVSEDEYRRLTECEQPSTTTTPLLVKSNHLDTEHIPQQQDEIVVFKKKHKCGHCEREYSDKHDLRRHKKKSHAKKDLDISVVSIKPQEEEEEKHSSSSSDTVKPAKQQYYRKDPFRENITKWRTIF